MINFFKIHMVNKMAKISVQQAMDALHSIDNPNLTEAEQNEAYFELEEFIRQVNDLMKVRDMTIPMLLKAKDKQ